MSILIGFLYVIEVVVCILLALVVMMQKPKEGGLGGVIGGGMGEAVFGADAGNVLIKTTAVLGVIFLLNTLILARLTSTVHAKSLMASEPEAVVEQQAAPTPIAPAALPEDSAAAELPQSPVESNLPQLPAPGSDK